MLTDLWQLLAGMMIMLDNLTVAPTYAEGPSRQIFTIFHHGRSCIISGARRKSWKGMRMGPGLMGMSGVGFGLRGDFAKEEKIVVGATCRFGNLLQDVALAAALDCDGFDCPTTVSVRL